MFDLKFMEINIIHHMNSTCENLNLRFFFIMAKGANNGTITEDTKISLPIIHDQHSVSINDIDLNLERDCSDAGMHSIAAF